MSSRVEEVKLWVSSFLNLKNDFEMERIWSNNIDIIIPLENPLENIPTETYLCTREWEGHESGCYAYLINLNKNLVKKIINSPVGYRDGGLAWNFISFKGDDLGMCRGSSELISLALEEKQVKKGFINTLDNLLDGEVTEVGIGGGYDYANNEFDRKNRNGYHFTWYMENYIMYKIIQSEKKFDFLNWDKNPFGIK